MNTAWNTCARFTRAGLAVPREVPADLPSGLSGRLASKCENSSLRDLRFLANGFRNTAQFPTSQQLHQTHEKPGRTSQHQISWHPLFAAHPVDAIKNCQDPPYVRAVLRGTAPINSMMDKRILPLAVSAFLAISLMVARSAAAPVSHESIEWCDIWISHANETNHPRVLLIGDSITRDYYPEVEKRLAGKAFVARLTTSRFLADPVLLKEIELVLDQMKFDVIHFNNGMHGWQYSEADYRKGFLALVETIEAHAPKARLIWAATTPLRDGIGANSEASATYSNERIAARNAIAAEIAAERNIPGNDLNAAMRGHPEFHSDNVHFNSQGIQIQATQVAAETAKVLPH